MGWFIDVKQYCPRCGAHVPSAHPPGRPFVCPQCGAELQHEVRGARRGGYLALALACVIALAFGARGWWLLVWGLALWFPSILAIASVELRYFPPKLEPWDGRKVV